MAAVGQQHIGPEAVEDLPGQFEEDVRLPPIGRPLGAAGSRRHDRHPHTVDSQVDDLGRVARCQLRLQSLIGQFQRGEHLVERCLPLGVENSRRL